MNLKEIARSRGTNLKQIADQCGVPASTLYAISRGDTNFDNVGIGTFLKLCDALGMTAEELYGYEDEPAVQLTDEERELLHVMRSITQDGQKQLMIYARGLLVTYPKNNQVPQIA